MRGASEAIAPAAAAGAGPADGVGDAIGAGVFDSPGREEKQTDVNIALKLLRLAVENAYDKAIIISGDTDLIPAVRTVKEMYPEKQIGVVIPIGGISEDFKRSADFHHKMKENHLKASLLSDPMKLTNGTILVCPPNWK